MILCNERGENRRTGSPLCRCEYLDRKRMKDMEENRKESYTIGLDFGTLSGRALLVNAANGEVMGEAVMEYPHGVITGQMPDGTPLPKGSALQYPGDYLRVLETIVPEVIKISGVRPEQVMGLGVDFTGCTLISLDRDGVPLCFREEFASQPLAWVIHWKHHADPKYGIQVTEAVRRWDPGLLGRHGGKVSVETMMPKVLQMVREAPRVYEAADLILEAGDWMVMQMTGRLVRSRAMAGFKAFWQKKKGFPDNGFYRELDPALSDFVKTKLRGEMRGIGEQAGGLTAEMAEKLGLLPGMAVAAAQLDGHAALAGAGIRRPGQVLLSLGTSGGFLVDYDRERPVEGTTGMTEDGDLPGFYGYASGQSGVGDMFAWFADRMVCGAYHREAAETGRSVQALLTEKAERLAPGESGLLALDWWNGNRSILADGSLSGLILGLTLETRPEEIYRALLESVAFGTRKIMKAHEQSGIPVEEICGAGGIVKKNPLLMQIYADVLNRPIAVCKTDQAAALGAAMMAAAAAEGEMNGGLSEAIRRMEGGREMEYRPIPDHVKVYNRLYEEYERLYDYFGRGANEVMRRLREMK